MSGIIAVAKITNAMQLLCFVLKKVHFFSSHVVNEVTIRVAPKIPMMQPPMAIDHTQIRFSIIWPPSVPVVTDVTGLPTHVFHTCSHYDESSEYATAASAQSGRGSLLATEPRGR